jgi:hypothetical protein
MQSNKIINFVRDLIRKIKKNKILLNKGDCDFIFPGLNNDLKTLKVFKN